MKKLLPLLISQRLLRVVLITLCLQGSLSLQAQVWLKPNLGQWEGDFLYKADIPGGILYVQNNALIYHFYDMATAHNVSHNHISEAKIQNHVVRVELVGSQTPTQVLQLEPSTFYENYMIGNDRSKWRSGVQALRKVVLKNVYPGIDWEIECVNGGIKHNFIVQGGANPNKILLRYIGADGLALKDDALIVKTKLGDIMEAKPESFVQSASTKVDYSAIAAPASTLGTPISSSYSLKGNELRFNVRKPSKDEVLTIDPIIIFSTFSGSVADNFGFTGTFNTQGEGYSGGTVYKTGFPVTTGAYQTIWRGGVDVSNENEGARDIGILKFTSDGKQLIWATYLGGTLNEQPHSMIVNSKGDLLVYGATNSVNFPTFNGYDNDHNGGFDIFVSLLSSDGRSLLGSTYFGGAGRDGQNGDKRTSTPTGPLAYNYGDSYRGEVIVDKNDNVLIASCTSTPGLPMNGLQPNYGGGAQDGIVVKFSPNLSSKLWSTYIGGSLQDAVFGIKTSNSGDVYICGGTESNNIPMTAGTFKTSYMGVVDGYIGRISEDGQNLKAMTYVGTSFYDQCYFLEIAPNGDVYVAGQSTGNMQVTSNVYFNLGAKQFIQAFSADLTTLKLGTTIGSGRSTIDFSPSAFLVDLCGRVCLSGWGGGANQQYNGDVGNTFNLTVTPDAFQKSTDGSDFYLVVLSQDMRTLVYASYFGGNVSEEHVDGGTSRFDRDGKIYQSVCGGCGGFSDFPTTVDAYSRLNLGKRPNNNLLGGCNNAFFKIDLNSSNFPPSLDDQFIRLAIGDTLDYSFNIVDNDGKDSIYVRFGGSLANPNITGKNIPSFRADSALNQTTGRLTWIPNCDNRIGDTLVLEVRMRDNGCPTPKESIAYIRVLLDPAPLPPPPEIFCLQRRGPNTIELHWDEFWPTSGLNYVKEYHLVKRLPNGTESVIKVICQSDDKTFIDQMANNHLITDYCYYMYGVNICGDTGAHTRTICTIPDKDSIPLQVNIWTATVERNLHVRVSWPVYQRDDFYRYELWKKENDAKGSWERLMEFKELTDTTYLDESVNVQKMSYCYRIMVRNQCGLYSDFGNEGCTILLQGLSQPFTHQLSWSPYTTWDGKVDNYSVNRRDPLTEERAIDSTLGTVTRYTDTSLNYDVGVYTYRIEATEGPGGGGATSVSNEITLYQQPIVYIPNAFSPNGDGTNDLWHVVPVFVKDYSLKVYNRWGQFVWETNDKKARFDGFYKGMEPFTNVFIWQIDYTGWEGTLGFKHGNVSALP